MTPVGIRLALPVLETNEKRPYRYNIYIKIEKILIETLNCTKASVSMDSVVCKMLYTFHDIRVRAANTFTYMLRKNFVLNILKYLMFVQNNICKNIKRDSSYIMPML